MKNNTRKIILALILVFTMMMSFATVSAFAAGEEDTKTFYFSNNKWWSTVNVHYWGGATASEWPGVAATFVEKNDYNEDIYSITVPADTTSIIFNNGADQTVDIDLSLYTTNGFYLTEKNAEGKWDVGTYDFTPSGNTPGTDPGVGGGSTDVVLGELAVGDYYLAGYIEGRDYGIEADSMNLGSYKFVNGKLTVDLTMAAYVVIKDGQNNIYWSPAYISTGNTASFVKSDKAEKMLVPGGKINFTLYHGDNGSLVLTYEIEKGTEIEIPNIDDTDTIRVYASNTMGWDTVYYYCWVSGGSEYVGWPGIEMEIDSEGYWYADIPKACDNIIFNNGQGGDGNQTLDLKVSAGDKNVCDIKGAIKDGTNSNINSWYTKAECKALEDFVADGGSLYILTNPQGSVEGWSMNDLAAVFGAKYTDKTDRYNDATYAAIEVDSNWEVVATGENGLPVRARRAFKHGRVVISGYSEEIHFEEIHDQASAEEKARKEAINKWRREVLDASFGWLCEIQHTFGDEYRPGQSGWGGGGAIYPELETNLDGFVVYYTPNMDETLKQTVVTEMPRITDQIMAWHPSTPTPEPMYLLLAAGGGGGWAVNAYKPKENGIISTDIWGLIGIYAHELAHTLGGPANAKGEKAGESPFHNQGEAHAGWFQGKVMAMYDSTLLERGNRNCEDLFTPEYLNIDLKRYTNDAAYADSCGKGKDWGKSWIIWQKMDDVYGPTWYPRWRNIQYTRWMDTPEKVLTWEETVEDMSIAVGEDLFPFFRALNTSLDREVCGELLFNGEKITLPAARIDATTPPGKVNLSAIGDWSKPLPKK
jgi:hypothetical protein